MPKQSDTGNVKTLRTCVRAVTAAILASAMMTEWSYAQQKPRLAPAQNELFSARSLKCVFPMYSHVETWSGDQPRLKSAKQDFGFHIDGIDHRARTARLIGNAAAVDLDASRGEDSISFVERVPAGTLNVTTVFAWRDTQGRFKAVHSRHTAIGLVEKGVSIGGPAPSQNYGFCQPW